MTTSIRLDRPRAFCEFELHDVRDLAVSYTPGSFLELELRDETGVSLIVQTSGSGTDEFFYTGKVGMIVRRIVAKEDLRVMNGDEPGYLLPLEDGSAVSIAHVPDCSVLARQRVQLSEDDDTVESEDEQPEDEQPEDKRTFAVRVDVTDEAASGELDVAVWWLVDPTVSDKVGGSSTDGWATDSANPSIRILSRDGAVRIPGRGRFTATEWTSIWRSAFDVKAADSKAGAVSYSISAAEPIFLNKKRVK